MTLMKMKGLTLDDFAVNHPAGRLGKRLTLKVADLMHGGNQNPTIQTGSTWVAVVKGISDGGLGAVNVLDEAGQLAGIITDGDLRRAIQRMDHASLEDLKSEEIMTRNPVVVSADTLAYDALRLMEDRPSQISVLPVVDGAASVRGLDQAARHRSQWFVSIGEIAMADRMNTTSKSIDPDQRLLLTSLPAFGQATQQRPPRIGEATITVKEQFFNSFLEAIFDNLKAPSTPLVITDSDKNRTDEAAKSCPSAITLQRENSGVKTAVKFEQGRL